MAVNIAEAKRLAALKAAEAEASVDGKRDSLEDIYAKKTLSRDALNDKSSRPSDKPRPTQSETAPQTNRRPARVLPRETNATKGGDASSVGGSVPKPREAGSKSDVRPKQETVNPKPPTSSSKPSVANSNRPSQKLSKTTNVDDVSNAHSEISEFSTTKGSENVDLNNSDGKPYDNKPSSDVKLIQVKVPESFIRSLRELVPSATNNNDAITSYLALLLSDAKPLSDRQAALYADLKDRDDLRQDSSFNAIESQIKALDGDVKRLRTDSKDRDMIMLALLGEMMLGSLGFSQSSFPKTPSDFSVDDYRSDNISDILRIIFKDVVRPHRDVIEDYKNPRLRN